MGTELISEFPDETIAEMTRRLSLIVFVAMITTLILASLFGALVPLLLKWANKDPVLGSSIFVTTVTDVGGFCIFLGLATLLMKFLNVPL